MYITSARQHILIAVGTLLLTVWVFLLLGHMFERVHQKDYPELEKGDIFVEKKQLDAWAVYADTKDNLRQHVMQDFLQSGFTGFALKPYEADSNTGAHITTWENSFTGDLVVQQIGEKDALDTYIDAFLASYNDTEYQVTKKPFLLSPAIYEEWDQINLFTSVKDLQGLGYKVVSHRMRKNTDPAYRRHNIKTAFEQFGDVRVIMPDETVSFMDEINYDPLQQELYKKGFTVVLDEDQTEYGGGLCGASTALYQGLLTNTAVENTEWRAHTQRRSYLYVADVNGERISTPGLDSTIYDNHIDYKIHNTASYPIIVVANYDGTSGGAEEVFSLAKSENQGSIEYVSRYSGCYTREINGEERMSCYKEVDGR